MKRYTIAICAWASIASICLANESSGKMGFESSGYDLYFGLDAGAIRSQPTDKNIETEKEGYFIGGKILVNYYKPLYSLDLSLGWMGSEIDGVRNKKEEESNLVEKNTVRQKLGFFEVAANYRWNESLEIGLLSRTLFGEDASFSPLDEDKKPVVTYLGLQLLKTFHTESTYFRVGPHILTDLNEKDREVSWIGITFQVGMPMSQRKMAPQIKEVTKIVEREKIVEVNKAIFILDSYHVNFETAKGEPTKEIAQFLKEVGQVLLEHEKDWSKIVIEGHSDPRGPTELNDRLSLERAEKVKKLMIASGLSSSRIETIGMGSKKPLDPKGSSVSLARNRRAEIFIKGLSNQGLINKLNYLKRKIEIPRTCRGQGCK